MDHLERAKLVLPHRLHLKMLPRRAAELYLDDYLPDLEGEDREYALSFAGQKLINPIKPRPQDHVFCAAMFQAGVSLGDLAKLFGIKKPTVHQKIGRKLNEEERQQRDRLDALDPEVLALCLRTFRMALEVDPSCYDDQYPRDIGRALLSASIAIVAEDRGETPAPSRPRRYANRHISEPSGKEIAAELVAEAESHTPEPDEPTVLPVTEPSQPAQPNTVRPDEAEWLNTL